MVVPVQHIRATTDLIANSIRPDSVVLSLAKGIERSTLMRPSQILADLLPRTAQELIGVLSGPNLAKEVLAGEPTATVVAIADSERARMLQSVLMRDHFRVYTSPDVVGCEIGGAVKNVIAIAAGIAAGLGYGWNSRSGLITRGLAELTRLGVALGGDPLTFLGLAGNGDLIATCSSDQSRNRSVGMDLGRGRTLESIQSGTKMVAEGVSSTPAILELARKVGVEMPVAEQVAAVLDGLLSPQQVVGALMGRAPTSELHDLKAVSR
jgi:glycerol-3-phosphate dehydrogenase (NAD(P)+)